MVSLIVAYAANGVIGKQNDLPWYLPEDLKRFKRLTTGHTVIMGRKTFESIIDRLKKPLPDRQNIVITSHPDPNFPDVTFVPGFDEALNASTDKEIFVIGGSRVFEAGLAKADRIYATEIQEAIDGDVYFPEINKAMWHITDESDVTEDAASKHSYKFVTYERVTP